MVMTYVPSISIHCGLILKESLLLPRFLFSFSMSLWKTLGLMMYFLVGGVSRWRAVRCPWPPHGLSTHYRRTQYTFCCMTPWSLRTLPFVQGLDLHLIRWRRAETVPRVTWSYTKNHTGKLKIDVNNKTEHDKTHEHVQKVWIMTLRQWGWSISTTSAQFIHPVQSAQTC